jgi:hypothetical protein
MVPSMELLANYLHLARASGSRRRPDVRTRLLVLAAVTAAYGSLDRIAAYCRQLVLQHNPHHMIGRWATVTAALEEEDFLHFLRHLERRYPCEQAERMLATLGFELTNERNAYYSDEEYAASLLNITTDRLSELFGSEG